MFRFWRSHAEGYLDHVGNGHVLGWAFTPAKPATRVRVRILVDGSPVTEGIADAYRSDLQELGYGDGCCAFFLPLPITCLDGGEHVVDVIVVASGRPLRAKRKVFRLDPVGTRHKRLAEVLFDAALYRDQAVKRGIGCIGDPYDHYRRVGRRSGLRPHPLFDSARYARMQGLGPEIDPLDHFGSTGHLALASVHALFDHPPLFDGDGRREHPVFAYIERRLASESEPSEFFSDKDYGARHPGVVEGGFLPLVHYLAFGWREGRRPHRDFDPAVFARLAGLKPEIEPYGYFVDWLRARRPATPASAPRLSIVILNLNKALLTLQCLYFLEHHTDLRQIEIIIVDNGSWADDFADLCRWAHGTTIVRIDTNRGFGEGNNIGAEHARGEIIAFVNNDVFVAANWLPPLLDVLDNHDDVGAVGPKFLYPDGRLQEAGATITTCGTAVQHGKHLDSTLPLFNATRAVDYCSAALLLVRTDAFHSVLGFDLCWDPAYYEDADLCLKLRTVGLATMYVHRSEVIHLEHATSADPANDSALRNIVAMNRLKFVSRWTQDPLPVFHKNPTVVTTLSLRVDGPEGSLALYTPIR